MQFRLRCNVCGRVTGMSPKFMYGMIYFCPEHTLPMETRKIESTKEKRK